MAFADELMIFGAALLHPDPRPTSSLAPPPFTPQPTPPLEAFVPNVLSVRGFARTCMSAGHNFCLHFNRYYNINN